jgi:hypothetical protein
MNGDASLVGCTGGVGGEGSGGGGLTAAIGAAGGGSGGLANPATLKVAWPAPDQASNCFGFSRTRPIETSYSRRLAGSRKTSWATVTSARPVMLWGRKAPISLAKARAMSSLVAVGLSPRTS